MHRNLHFKHEIRTKIGSYPPTSQHFPIFHCFECFSDVSADPAGWFWRQIQTLRTEKIAISRTKKWRLWDKNERIFCYWQCLFDGSGGIGMAWLAIVVVVVVHRKSDAIFQSASDKQGSIIFAETRTFLSKIFISTFLRLCSFYLVKTHLAYIIIHAKVVFQTILPMIECPSSLTCRSQTMGNLCWNGKVI